MALRLSCTSPVIVTVLLFCFIFEMPRSFPDPVAQLVYSLMYDMRSPLLLRVLEVFTPGFPHSHLAYAIRFIHSTRADGVCPYPNNLCLRISVNSYHIRPSELLVEHDFAYLRLGTLRQVA